jgi:hypothetical protein
VPRRASLLLCLAALALVAPAVPVAPTGVAHAVAAAPAAPATGLAPAAVGDGALLAQRRRFGTRRSPFGTRRRTVRRRSSGSFGRSVLRALGIAWLVSALFGWGAGGSPFGLLLLVGLLWLVFRAMRGPRRRAAS